MGGFIAATLDAAQDALGWMFAATVLALPLGKWRRSRDMAAWLYGSLGILYGLVLWVFSLVSVYGRWGMAAAIIGGIAGIGVVPMALFIAIFLAPDWDQLIGFVVISSLALGCTALGFKLEISALTRAE